jgi:hypothetical protein
MFIRVPVNVSTNIPQNAVRGMLGAPTRCMFIIVPSNRRVEPAARICPPYLRNIIIVLFFNIEMLAPG